MQVSVSIEPYLTAEKEQLKQYIEEIVRVSNSLAQQKHQVSLHFDYFKPNQDAFALVQSYSSKIDIDLHLMQEPAPSVKGFRSVSFDSKDLDLCLKQQDFVKYHSLMHNIRELKHECCGLVLDLGSEINGYESLIREFKYIIIMTVKCGKSGQVFQESALSLIEQVRQLNPHAEIIIDGGINENNVNLAKKAGANIVVVGTYAKKCYESGDLEKGINRLLRV